MSDDKYLQFYLKHNFDWPSKVKSMGVFKYDPVLNVLIDLKLGRINVHLIKEMSDESIWI